MNKIFAWLACLLVIALAFGGCTSGQKDGSSAAAETMQTYLQALVDKDEALLTSLVCPDFEMDALLEYDSFQAVETKLTGLTCRETGGQDGAALVNCQGQIDATYGNEVQSFDLGARTYTLTKNGADWQVCGYNLP